VWVVHSLEFTLRETILVKVDGLVKSPKLPIFVIPAKAGIQEYQLLLDPGLRRGDGLGDFLRMC
jgi:hypothetical protein